MLDLAAPGGLVAGVDRGQISIVGAEHPRSRLSDVLLLVARESTPPTRSAIPPRCGPSSHRISDGGPPGTSHWPGITVGVEEVKAFFGELTRADLPGGGRRLGGRPAPELEHHPAGLDIMWALAFRISRNKISEAVNFASDQHAADTFCWRRYPLAKLPDRLANHLP